MTEDRLKVILELIQREARERVETGGYKDEVAALHSVLIDIGAKVGDDMMLIRRLERG